MSKRVAVVIGVGYYRHYQQLSSCPASAQDVFEILTSPLYGQCDSELSSLITVPSETDIITPSQIDDKIDEIIDKLLPDDQFIFYFSGHGEVHQNNELLLLLPDSQKDQWTKKFVFSSLIKKLSINNVNKAIIIIDTCHSAAMFNSIKDLQGNVDMEHWSLPAGIVFMAATAKHEYASQSPELKRTLFSYYLCQGVKQWRNPSEKYIPIHKLRRYINEQITQNHDDARQKAELWLHEKDETIWLTLNPSHPEHLLSDLSKKIPFTNRDDDIRELTDSEAAAYYLIEAPAGFGKTELLIELKRRFSKKQWAGAGDLQLKWSCSYIIVKPDNTFEELVNSLAVDLDIVTSYEQQSKHLPIEVRLSSALARQWGQDDHVNENIGLILLLDFEHPVDSSGVLIEQLVQILIPTIQENLRNLEVFIQKKRIFRVLLAGRYLSDLKSIQKAPLPFSEHPLKTFRYDIIRATARNFLETSPEESVVEISAHTFYLAGGHPGCTAQIFARYQNSGLTPEQFMKYFGRLIYPEIVELELNRILGEITHNNKSFLEKIRYLSTFRRFDTDLLRELRKKLELFKDSDEHQLARDLTATTLFKRSKRVLEDDITRRLLSIQSRYALGNEFSNRCRFAKELYKIHLIENQGGKVPEIWALEYLFQSLQEFANQVDDDRACRANLKKHFLEVEVPIALNLLISTQNYTDIRDIHNEIILLKDEIKGDWEFEFTVNYYLREDKYTDQPIQKLMLTIDTFLEAQLSTQADKE